MSNQFTDTRPKIEFAVPLEEHSFEFDTESIAFNPDYTSPASIQEALAELRQIRLRLIRGLAIVKVQHANHKRSYNAWLAEARNILRPDGKSFKNLDEAQDAVYTYDADLVMKYEGRIEKSRTVRDELSDLLETVKDVMYSYTRILDVLSR